MAWECFACGWDGKGESFALQGDLLCPRRQSRQSAAGGWRLEKHSVFLCRLPPDPRLFTGEPPRNVEKICPARAKDRIPFLVPPAAAPCCLNRYLLLQEPSRLASIHRVTVWWSVRLRGWCLGQGVGAALHASWFAAVLWSVDLGTYFGTGVFRLPPTPGGYIQ